MSNEIIKLPEYQDPANLDEAKTKIIQLGRNMGEHAYIIGRILTWVKSQLEHGKFLIWTEKNVWFTHRTAQRFMSFSAKCDDKQKLLIQPHYLEKEKSDKLSYFRNQFDLIEIVNQQLQEVTNGKMRISEERTGLEIIDPMTQGEWDESFEVIKALPVNKDAPISKLEGLACFLIGDWFIFYEKIETAIKGLQELEILLPGINAYIHDEKTGDISKERLNAVQQKIEQRINEFGSKGKAG